MALSSEPQLLPAAFQTNNQFSQNPFAHRKRSSRETVSIEEYIKEWIQKILYQNKKIDQDSKLIIQRKLANDKSGELSSCSIVYSIIRQKIKEISSRLRMFIQQSFQTLSRECHMLCGIGDLNNAWNKNWWKFKSQNQNQFHINVYPQISRMFVIYYRYMSEVSREAYNFWKILYECTQIKDLRFTTFQNSLNQLILQTFTQSTEVFSPKLMLPTMSFGQKCRFIYAQVQGIVKRQQLTRFYEDDMVKMIVSRKQKIISKKQQDYQSEMTEIRRISRYNNIGMIDKKFEALQKKRLDHKYMEQLRRYYVQNQGPIEEQSSQPQQIKEKDQLGLIDQMNKQKIQLIDILKSNSDIVFQNEDAYSEEDSDCQLAHFYLSNDNYREQLIDEGDNLEIELTLNPQKNIQNKETEGSSKLSSSSGQQQLHDNHQRDCDQADVIIKNYEVDVPPEFIYNQEADQFSILQNMLEQKKCQKDHMTTAEQQFQLSLEANLKMSMEQNLKDGISEKMTKLRQNINKSKENMQNDKKVEFLDKKKLEEEKEKLEKYRKQLEKQKQELLKQVQRFMKEKKKEENLLMMMKESTAKNSKFHRNHINCKCQNMNAKIINKLEEHQQKLGQINLKYQTQQLATAEIQKQNIPALIFSKDIKQISEDVKTDLIVKTSKKQQKQQKKDQRQIKQAQKDKVEKVEKEKAKIIIKPKQQKIDFCEQEANLSNFLERLNIDDSNRVACNIQQTRLDSWKLKINQIRAGNYQLTLNAKQLQSPTPLQPAQSKKKRRNRK